MEFRFKPALIRSEETWSIDGTRLSGPDLSVDLSEVSACDFTYAILKRGITVSELKLTVNQEEKALTCNGLVRSPDRDTFLRMVVDILRVLGTRQPELKVTSKGTDIMTWGFTTLGVLCVLWGVYFAVANVADNSRNFAFGVAGVMGLMGVFMIWVGSPWKSNRAKSLTETQEWIERLRAL